MPKADRQNILCKLEKCQNMFPHKISTFLEAQHIHSLQEQRISKEWTKEEKIPPHPCRVHFPPLSPCDPHRVNFDPIWVLAMDIQQKKILLVREITKQILFMSRQNYNMSGSDQRGIYFNLRKTILYIYYIQFTHFLYSAM